MTLALLLLSAVAYAPITLPPLSLDAPAPAFFGRWAAEQMQGSLRQMLRARDGQVLWS